MLAHDPFHRLPDGRKPAAAPEKGGDCDFVGGIQDGGKRASGFSW